MILLFVLFGLCVPSVLSDNAGTTGTEFRVVFPRNFELSSTNCNLSITIVNGNKDPVQVQVSYYAGLYDYNSLTHNLYTVPAEGLFEAFFPHFDAWEYMNGGLQSQFDTRIVVTTSIPITLYANNYQKDGYGDTYLVLPYTMAGTSYSLTLPSAASLQNGVIQYSIIYIIPTRKDVNVEITNGDYTYKKLIPFAIGTNLYYYSVPYNIRPYDPSFYITGDNDFLVVAAVSCLPTTTQTCDYAAFMPTPIANKACDSPDPLQDFHPTDLVNARSFSLTPPLKDCGASSVTLFNDNSNSNTTLSASIYSVPGIIGDRVVFLSETTKIQPIRIGGLPGNGGAFLTNVPSTTQFVPGTTYFQTRSEDATLWIVTDALASLTMRLDGGVVAFSPEIIKINGNQFHFTSVQVKSQTSPMVHTLMATSGKYIFYVTGSLRPNHLYGFYPAFNSAA